MANLSSLKVPLTLFKVINCGDFLEYLTGGYYKSAVHRVIKPPRDQDGFKRLGLIYFHYTADPVLLKPLLESPVVQRHGISKKVEGEPPTMEKWRKTRTAVYGIAELKKGTEQGIEYEIVNGVQVRHYN
jgi:isopenicillin N synthase-like dioxygenase